METLVKIENNRAVTNSLLVAEKFNKNHRDVLQSIRDLLVSAENSAITENQSVTSMFHLAEYKVALNNGTGAMKKHPMYIMNRDGFSLLVMGFTGEKALNFKLEFINAFNEMEKKLHSDDYILMRSRQILENKVAQLEYKSELQAQELKKQAPKVEYYNHVLNAENTYNINLIAKELGMSARTLNKILAEKKIQYKQAGVWVLNHKFQDKGFTKTKTTLYIGSDGVERSCMLTVWTEKGREFIHNQITLKTA